MNAHTPFDAKKDWSNPYCQNSSNDPMVDALLGNAYHVVRTVYCNLGNLKLIYDFLNQYGMVLGVQSEAELKALTTKAKYARIYGFSRAGDRQVTDYLYVEGDRTGIIPDDPEATGSWITVATSGSTGGGTSSGEGAYIPWVYANGSATGGETSINVPDGTVGVPFIIINGDMQYVGRGFEFNVDSLSVTLAQPLEEGDEVVFLLTGVPAVPDNPNVNDWVQINWLYNNGAAVGGEQVIAVPYTFQSVPAVYKNGLRLYKGLTTESYTADPDNQRILLTEPLATNDRLIVQIGGEAQVLEAPDHTLQEVARAANVKDSEVILSTDTTQFLNGKKVVYSVSEQRIYSLPTLPTNIYIQSVSNGQLTYLPGGITVDLLPIDSATLLREELKEEGGDRLVNGFTSIDSMKLSTKLSLGDVVSTGRSKWEIVSSETPIALANGLFAKLLNSLYIDDFAGTGTDKINSLNAYITHGMQSSYASSALLEAYKYSLTPVHVVFTSLVETEVPLLLMRHVHYDQVGSQTYFNRQMPVGLYYAPTNLNTAITEPVVFELSGGVYVRKTGSLIGTVDNDIMDGNGYITLSDGFLFDLSVACTGGTKIGLNFSMAPGCKGTKTSVGITERGGNLVSVPLLGMYFRWSWGADFRSPKVLAMRQGIHLYRANAGLRITNPYVARMGSNADNPELVYPAAAWTAEGKNQNTGITVDTVRDFVIDEPIVEWWRQAFALSDSDVTIRKPHVEDVGGNMIMRHNFVIANSYLDLDNWSQINYTCLSYCFYFCGQDGGGRKVIARGMPPVGGFTNGMVGGTFISAPLSVENASPAIIDYGSIGNWSAINYLGMDFYREVFVNPTTGNDENSGLVSRRPVASLERAIEIINIVQQKGKFKGDFVINVAESVSLTRVVTSYKGFRINASSATITSSPSAHIELSGDINVTLVSGTFSGTAALLYQLPGKIGVFIIESAVVSTPAVITSTKRGQIFLQQISADTTGILKYVDGSGKALVMLMVRSASRNTAIDANPVSINQFAGISSITS